jgi:hypothetical protein
MYPQVRHYRDPFEGLKAQLTELKGLIKIVPPLIEADRERRWEEIGPRPGDGSQEMIDIYEDEAGPEEGWGHADFSHTIQAAAVVTAWGVFHECLIRQLFESCLPYNLEKYPVLDRLVTDERRRLDRRFEDIQRRYADFAEVYLKELSNWDAVVHAHQLRNAIVHNSGQYTLPYLRTKLARRPTADDLNGIISPGDDAALVNKETIPLSPDFTEGVISDLVEAAREVSDALSGEPMQSE